MLLYLPLSFIADIYRGLRSNLMPPPSLASTNITSSQRVFSLICLKSVWLKYEGTCKICNQLVVQDPWWLEFQGIGSRGKLECKKNKQISVR